MVYFFRGWSSFTKRISINASPARIFNSWQSQEQIESWFLSSAVFTTAQGKIRPSSSQIQEGDTYQWMWYGSDNVANGEVLEVNGQNKLRFTFLDCEVSVFIKEEEGETLVELMQSKISLDETSKKNTYVGCTRGWTFYLTNLKSILEGGIDLRNRNKKLLNVINT